MYAIRSYYAEPAQIAISCNKDNFTCDLIKKSGFFSISVLKQETKSDLIGLFGYQSGRTTNKFESTQHIVSENKTPIVTEDSIAWFECKVVSNVDVGTHLMFIAEIIDNDLLDVITSYSIHYTKLYDLDKNPWGK